MKWIDVEDELPDEEDYYLVTDGYGRPWRDFYSPLTDQWLSQARGICYWMPLPEPPTIKTKNGEI